MAHTQQKVESHSNVTNLLLCKYFNQLTIHVLISLNVGDWELNEALVDVVITCTRLPVSWNYYLQSKNWLKKCSIHKD